MKRRAMKATLFLTLSIQCSQPPLAGILKVECKMQAAVDEGVGVGRGSFGDSGKEDLPLDPFLHKYDVCSKAQQFQQVNVAGSPFAITVLEVPFSKRMKASKSSVEILDDGDGGSWRRMACLGGGSIAFVRLQLRDLDSKAITLENMTSENLTSIASTLRSMVKVQLKRCDQSPQIVPIGNGACFEISNALDLANADVNHSSPRTSPRSRRDNFARKFSGGGLGSYMAGTEGPDLINPEVEVELSQESFNMMESRRTVGGEGAAGVRESALLKIHLPPDEDLFTLHLSCDGEHLKNSPLLVSVVPALSLGFARDRVLDGDCRLHDG